ncbi:MAG: arginase [Beijerinckiaceae bacterium]|nr:arginase [Beijerinckiaceae bacterium]MCZ8299093.1 arginase [Beijerinckiaceae bacterium]
MTRTAMPRLSSVPPADAAHATGAQLGLAIRATTAFGVPCGAGAGVPGTELGPAAARLAGLPAAFEHLDLPFRDDGDLVPEALAPHPRRAALGHHAEAIAGWIRAVHDRSHALLEQGACPIMLGGDHALSMGSVSAAARHAREQGHRFVLLWIDAHADFNTPETSPSGNLHGMSLQFLAGHEELAHLLPGRNFPALRMADVHLIGARSLDRREREAVAEAGIHCHDMRAIDEFGVCALLRNILDGLDPAETHLHVSFDLDVVDPGLAPGVGTPVAGGLSYREAHLLMEMLHESGLVRSVDFVELNPMLDHAGQTARLLVDLAASLFGKTISLR